MQSENARNRNMAMNQTIGQGYDKAFQAAQQAQQFGANLGLQGLQGALSGYGQAGAAAGTLGQLGQTQFGQQQGINTAQQQVGAVQQAQAQQNLDQGYQDFLKQQNYPYQQLAFMSDMTRGLPLSQSAATQYTAPPSMVSQLGGLGMAGLGAYGAAGGFKKDGGIISSYKEGGKIGYNTGGDISMMSDEQLTELLGNPQLNPMEMKAVEDMLALRRRMEINPQSAAIMNQDRSGIGAIATGDMVPEDMAGGGIIAFKDKGAVKDTAIDDEGTLQSEIAKLRGSLLDKPTFSQSDKMQAALAEEIKSAKEAAPWNFIRDLGVGTMAGTSQFGLSNLGGGASYANTEAGKRAAIESENKKLAMQQQVEAEKAELARKSGILNNMQTSLTQTQNKKLGLAQIAATKEAANQSRLDALDVRNQISAAANFRSAFEDTYKKLSDINSDPLKTRPDEKLSDEQITAKAKVLAFAILPKEHQQFYSQYAQPNKVDVASLSPYEQYKTRFKEYSGNPEKQKQLTEFFRSKGVIK
jgi:hypothetical protein